MVKPNQGTLTQMESANIKQELNDRGWSFEDIANLGKVIRAKSDATLV